MFKLDALLAADTIEIGDLPLCKVLLMNNAHVPWLVLVPRINNVREIYQLDAENQVLAHQESLLISKLIMGMFEGEKLNTAAIGNIVAQLHLHFVVRYQNDVCWPKPVWGNMPLQPYSTEEQDLVCEKLINALSNKSAGFIAR